MRSDEQVQSEIVNDQQESTTGYIDRDEQLECSKWKDGREKCSDSESEDTISKYLTIS